MLWAAENVAWFARQAGWSGDDLIAAVEHAWMTSGFDDAYRYTGPAGGYRDERGLWGVDRTMWPDVPDVNLFAPQANARAAYGLWRASGRSFVWSPADGWEIGPADHAAIVEAVKAPTPALAPASVDVGRHVVTINRLPVRGIGETTQRLVTMARLFNNH